MAPTSMIIPSVVDDGNRLRLVRRCVEQLFNVSTSTISNAIPLHDEGEIKQRDSVGEFISDQTPGVQNLKRFENLSIRSDNDDSRNGIAILRSTDNQHQDLISPLCVQMEGSQESLEKAQVFAQAHLLLSTEDYVTRSQQLDSEQEFEMVQQCSVDLQTSTLALLTFAPEKFEVTYQGSETSVKDAESRVGCILSNLRSKEGKTFNERERDNNVNETVREDGQSYNDNNMPGSESTLCEGNIQRQSVSVTGSGTSEESTNDTDHEAHRDKSGDEKRFSGEHEESIHRGAVSLKRSSSVSSFSSSASDEDICAEENIITDSQYRKQVEQAVRLGFSEEHGKKALSKLGLDCDLNDLLKELIQIGEEDSIKDEEVFDSIPLFSGRSEPGSLDYNHGSLSLNSADVSPFTSSEGESVERTTPFNYNDSSNLRHIIIDGSNVAWSHGKTVFSCKGIKIAVDWFRARGHTDITAFVPQWRKEASRPDAPITDQEILIELEKEKVVVFTPSRRVKGRRIVCYDDRFILELAQKQEGIVVSNDIYRDLCNESEEYKKVVEQRLLMYSFAGDIFMPPVDPYGRGGISLDNLLRKVPMEPTSRPQECPYGKKCTYGNKCRFYHPERGYTPQRSVTETLKEQAEIKLQEIANRRPKQKLVRTKSFVPGETVPSFPDPRKHKLAHSKSVVLPVSKSGDYLNEPRRKMEAELSAALERETLAQQKSTSPMGSSIFSTPIDACNSRSVFEDPVGQGNSARTSPVPERDIPKHHLVTGTSSVPGSSSPMKSMVTSSQRSSPSHLTVPKNEQPERYLSGHLLVAKKLSDEGNSETNFFSEHVSSPSSTRTSSPVVPLGKNLAGSDSLSRESLLDTSPTHSHGALLSGGENLPNLSIFQSGDSGGVSGASLTYSSEDRGSLELLHRKGSTGFPSQNSGFQDDNLPELSIFDYPREGSGASSPSSRTVTGSGKGRAPTDEFPASPSVFSPVSDSGNFSGSETHPSPNVHQQSYFHRFPSMSGEHVYPEHGSLRRAHSSTGHVVDSGDQVPLGLRGESHRVSQGRPAEHQALKPQHSGPLRMKQPLRRQSHQFELSRQNSTSDPQIHYRAMAGYRADRSPAVFSPPPSAEQDSRLPAATSTLMGHQQLLPQQQQFYYLQQQQQQQQHTDPQHRLAHRQSVGEGKWVEQSVGGYPMSSHMTHQQASFLQGPSDFTKYGQPQQTYAAQRDTNLQHTSYGMPVQQYMFAQSPSTHLQTQIQQRQFPQQQQQQPHLLQHQLLNPHAGYSSHMTTSPGSFPFPDTTQQPPPPHPPQPGFTTPFPSVGSTFNMQEMSATSPRLFYQPIHAQQPPAASAMAAIPPEKRLIPQSDPQRYLLFHRLCPLFGEEVVRKVMNKNPNALTPEELCPLIIAYKQETGL